MNAPDKTRAPGRRSRPGTRSSASSSDTGCGIPPEQISHLFDRFWQAEKGARHGAGLGLEIAKGIIEAHGGQIWVESELGQGTTFFFFLPHRSALPEASTNGQ
ncbi:MAG: sensor histidine kinase [Persicimonas sp.]